MTLSVQYVTMGLMMASGVGMGIIFDVYRVLTGQMRILKRLVPLLDLVYWALVTLFVFRMLERGNEGQLRFFVFIGLVIGVSLYYWLFGRATRELVRRVILAVKWLARMLRRLFMLCVVRPIVGLYKLVMLLLGFAASVAVLFLKIVLQLLYPVRMLLRFLWKITGGHIPWGKLGRRLTATKFYSRLLRLGKIAKQGLRKFRR